MPHACHHSREVVEKSQALRGLHLALTQELLGHGEHAPRQQVEQELLPHMTDAERRANSYYNRRAPNCQIAVESLEAITFMTSIPS